MLKIKFFAVAAFLAVAACAFLFSNNRSQAQTGKTAQNRDAILQTIAGYKAWKQVVKPEKKTAEPEIIINSTAMG
jgi:hypothetical protein